jgi:hypothetical protein
MKSRLVFLLILCSTVFTVHAQTMRSLSAQQAAASSALRWTVTECSGRSADLAPSAEPVSVLRNDGSGIRVYPNPASELLHIDFSQSLTKTDVVTLEITDLMGRKVKNISPATGSFSANCQIQELPEGIYLLRMMGKDAVLSTHKWVKKN